MPRHVIKRLMPDHKTVREHRHLRWLGTLLHDPNLWHLNRRSVAGAAFIGLFCAFLPVPFQMVLAALAAIVLRINLPIAVVLVWVTNPLTMGPIFFFAYKVGTLILNTPLSPALAKTGTMVWLGNQMQAVWQPLLLGSLVCGTLSGLIGALFVRISWRLHVIQRWKARRKRKARGPQQA